MIELRAIKQEPVRQHLIEIGTKPSENRAVRPRIRLNKCEKNYCCAAYCPRNAISIDSRGFPAVNYDLCDGCLICLRECPAVAITEEKEND
jgi:2-oxoacid:acceptor oxidoreductase delta subunit (pyruvate/2-ketoisovalerate family)